MIEVGLRFRRLYIQAREASLVVVTHHTSRAAGVALGDVFANNYGLRGNSLLFCFVNLLLVKGIPLLNVFICYGFW